MANKLVSVFHNNVPSRENTNQGVWDYNAMRVGADLIPIDQDGAGVNARLSIGARIKIADGTQADDASSKGQMETYVGTQVGNLTASEGLVRVTNDFQIAAKGVTTAKIDDKAVTATQLADATITVTQLADDAVETVKIKDANVTTSKIALKNITTALIDDKAVTATQIADSTITVTQLANDSVETAKIKDLNITTNKVALKNITTALINDKAVTTTQIDDKAVTTGQIGDQAVDTLQLKDSAVTHEKIADNAVITAKLNNKAVTNAKIDDLAVSTANIQLEAVTNSRLGAGAVTTDKIASSGVQNNNIQNGAVTGNKLNTAYRFRIGVNGDLTYEDYSSTTNIQASDTYPTAISKLDAAVNTITSSTPQQYSETVAIAGQTIFDVPLAMAFALDDLIPDIEVTVNGKKQVLGEEYNKTSTVRITFSYGLPIGAEVLITKERTGGVPTVVNGVDVKQNGSLITESATSINYTGAGVSVMDAGGGEVTVNITGGGGGSGDLSAVDQDIIPDANNTRVIGSVTNAWNAVYLADNSTGDVYKLRIDNGYLEAILM